MPHRHIKWFDFFLLLCYVLFSFTDFWFSFFSFYSCWWWWWWLFFLFLFCFFTSFTFGRFFQRILLFECVLYLVLLMVLLSIFYFFFILSLLISNIEFEKCGKFEGRKEKRFNRNNCYSCIGYLYGSKWFFEQDLKHNQHLLTDLYSI